MSISALALLYNMSCFFWVALQKSCITVLLNAPNLLWVAIAMNSCWFLHKHLILQSEMLPWCKPSAVKSANALWLDVGRFRSNSAGDPTNLQHATTSDDHHNSFEIDSQQFCVQQSLSKVSRISTDFHQFCNIFPFLLGRCFSRRTGVLFSAKSFQQSRLVVTLSQFYC